MIPRVASARWRWKLLALVPHANGSPGGPQQQLSTKTRFLKNTTAFDSKFDFNRKDNDRFAFRFSRAVQNLNDQPTLALPEVPRAEVSRARACNTSRAELSIIRMRSPQA